MTSANSPQKAVGLAKFISPKNTSKGACLSPSFQQERHVETLIFVIWTYKPIEMRKIDSLLSEYGESHRNPTNKAVHWICVPAIMFSLLGLLWNIPAGPLDLIPGLQDANWANWSVLLLLMASVYYLRLSIPLFVGMVFISLAMIYGNLALNQLGSTAHLTISFGIFALAWVGQFIGHKIEGKKPSFLKDVQFLLVGPAWLMHFIFKKVGITY
jgi:uncharacterized membrane protein YGL010W